MGTSPRFGSPKLISAIDVSGFAAIMVFLVSIFMARSGINHGHRVIPSVSLPTAAHPRPLPHAQREDAIFISVLRNGDVFLGNDLVRSSGILHQRISNSVEAGSEPTIYINADGRAKYQVVKDVIDEIAQSGLHNVVFLAYEGKT